MNPGAKKRKQPSEREKRTLDMHLDKAPLREFPDTVDYRPKFKARRTNPVEKSQRHIYNTPNQAEAKD